jgi:hypothetical protein
MHVNPYRLWECAAELVNLLAVMINLSAVSDKLTAAPVRTACHNRADRCASCGAIPPKRGTKDPGRKKCD